MTHYAPKKSDQQRLDADRQEAALAMQILAAAGLAADQAGQSLPKKTFQAAVASAPMPAKFNQDRPSVLFSDGVADEAERVCHMLGMSNVSGQFETIKVLAQLGAPPKACWETLAHGRSLDMASEREMGRQAERQRIMGILNQPGAGADLRALIQQINSGASVAAVQQNRATAPMQSAQTADALAKSILDNFALLEK